MIRAMKGWWLGLLVALAAHAGGATPSLRVHSLIGSGEATAYLVSSGPQALVVDVPVEPAQLDSLIRTVRERGARLETVYLTRPAPLPAIQALAKAFPAARILAKPALFAALTTGLPAAETRLTRLDDTRLEVGAQSLEVVPVGANAFVLWAKTSRELFTGPLVLRDRHLELGSRAEAQVWLRALQQLEALSPRRVYPGAGASGGPELIRQNREYLTFLNRAGTTAKTTSELTRQVRARFPRLAAAERLDRTASAWFPGQQPDAGSRDGGPVQAEAPIEPGTRIDPPPDRTK